MQGVFCTKVAGNVVVFGAYGLAAVFFLCLSLVCCVGLLVWCGLLVSGGVPRFLCVGASFVVVLHLSIFHFWWGGSFVVE